MPSQQEMRGGFLKLVMPLMRPEPDFNFSHQITHERTFISQITTDCEFLTYFTQIEERIHAFDSRKVLKLPKKPTPVKADADNTGDTQPKGKSKGLKGERGDLNQLPHQILVLRTNQMTRKGERKEQDVERDQSLCQNPPQVPRTKLQLSRRLQAVHQQLQGEIRDRL